MCNNQLYRLFNIQPLLRVFLVIFYTIYKPNQQLSLFEARIPWRGWLQIQTYKPGKIIKYDLLICMVTESTSVYTWKLEIYTGEGKKWQISIFTFLEPYLNQNYLSTKTTVTIIPRLLKLSFQDKYRTISVYRNILQK